MFPFKSSVLRIRSLARLNTKGLFEVNPMHPSVPRLLAGWILIISIIGYTSEH